MIIQDIFTIGTLLSEHSFMVKSWGVGGGEWPMRSSPGTGGTLYFHSHFPPPFPIPISHPHFPSPFPIPISHPHPSHQSQSPIPVPNPSPSRLTINYEMDHIWLAPSRHNKSTDHKLRSQWSHTLYHSLVVTLYMQKYLFTFILHLCQIQMYISVNNKNIIHLSQFFSLFNQISWSNIHIKTKYLCTI